MLQRMERFDVWFWAFIFSALVCFFHPIVTTYSDVIGPNFGATIVFTLFSLGVSFLFCCLWSYFDSRASRLHKFFGIDSRILANLMSCLGVLSGLIPLASIYLFWNMGGVWVVDRQVLTGSVNFVVPFLKDEISFVPGDYRPEVFGTGLVLKDGNKVSFSNVMIKMPRTTDTNDIVYLSQLPNLEKNSKKIATTIVRRVLNDKASQLAVGDMSYEMNLSCPLTATEKILLQSVGLSWDGTVSVSGTGTNFVKIKLVKNDRVIGLSEID